MGRLLSADDLLTSFAVIPAQSPADDEMAMHGVREPVLCRGARRDRRSGRDRPAPARAVESVDRVRRLNRMRTARSPLKAAAAQQRRVHTPQQWRGCRLPAHEADSDGNHVLRFENVASIARSACLPRSGTLAIRGKFSGGKPSSCCCPATSASARTVDAMGCEDIDLGAPARVCDRVAGRRPAWRQRPAALLTDPGRCDPPAPTLRRGNEMPVGEDIDLDDTTCPAARRPGVVPAHCSPIMADAADDNAPRWRSSVMGGSRSATVRRTDGHPHADAGQGGRLTEHEMTDPGGAGRERDAPAGADENEETQAQRRSGQFLQHRYLGSAHRVGHGGRGGHQWRT